MPNFDAQIEKTLANAKRKAEQIERILAKLAKRNKLVVVANVNAETEELVHA